jgi:hypothetical protein
MGSLYEVQKLLGHSGANVNRILGYLQPDRMRDTSQSTGCHAQLTGDTIPQGLRIFVIAFLIALH